MCRRPEEEIRAIALYTLLGREGVQVRLNSSVGLHLVGSKRAFAS
jgi:hypothetical protein